MSSEFYAMFPALAAGALTASDTLYENGSVRAAAQQQMVSGYSPLEIKAAADPGLEVSAPTVPGAGRTTGREI